MTLAQAQFTVNGGAPFIGAPQIVAGGSVIQFSGVNPTPWQQARWELFGFPKAWAAPAGWTYDASKEVVFSTALTPTPITLPVANVMWGTWLMRLIVNNGVDPTAGVTGIVYDDTGLPLPSSAIDIKCGVATLSPTFSFREIALYEGTQFGGVRSWVDALQTMQHALETALGSGHHAWVDTLLDGVAVLELTDTNNCLVDCSAFTADRTIKLPATPRKNQCVTFKFQDASLVAHNAIIDGNGNSVQGYQTAAAATYTMGNVPWGAYGSATFCFNGTIWETI